MINDSCGTSADTEARGCSPVSAEARIPFPAASSSERDIVCSGERGDDNEKCVGGPRVAGPAVGTSSRRRMNRRWTYRERRAVIAMYEAEGPAAAVRLGASFGASKVATLSVVDQHRSINGLPTWAEVQRAKLVDILAELGQATTKELAARSGLSAPTVRHAARCNGWIETRTRHATMPGRCEQSWRLPS